MAISRLGYFQNFYGNGIDGSKKAGAGYQAYFSQRGTAEGAKEAEKNGLDIKQDTVKGGQTEVMRGNRLRDHLSGEDRKAPYYYLSEDGVINYKGVTFYCDTQKNQLTLGDTSDSKNCLTIPLAGGGSLVVNRDNIDELSKAITMFSPEDINRIMRALQQDAKARQMQEEIEDEKCAVGEKITDSGKETEAGEPEEAEGTEPMEMSGEWKSSVYKSMDYENND